MKVLVIGGYGVFGERLARLLIRDGHQVTIAGRDLAKAQDLAAKLGCSAQHMDREGDPAGLIGHEVMVDAAGPFHTDGDDPWRLARAAIAPGCITLTCQTMPPSAPDSLRWTGRRGLRVFV
jgi:short subunit dehydrogenase-like uncharacterized protein